MEPQTEKRRLLVWKGRDSGLDAMLEMAGEHVEIIQVQSAAEALELLKKSHFDAVITDIWDFLPLERASVSEQAVAILNTIGEGVCIADTGGKILWANRKIEAFGECLFRGIAEQARQAYKFWEKHGQEVSLSREPFNRIRPRKASFTDPQTERYYEMIITPMPDSTGTIRQLAVVVQDVTDSQLLQKRINAIDKAGSELVRLEAEVLTGKSVEERIGMIQDKVIRYAKQLLHFDHFVVRLLNRKTNQLEVLFNFGIPAEDEMEIFASRENNGISGYVAVTGRSYICNNTRTDSHYLPGLEGAQSSLTVPLRLQDQVIGVWNVESLGEAAFTEDDRQMAEIFGRYVAIALNILDLLVVERYKTTGQAAEILSRQISKPLDGLMNEVSQLFEDYIGHDDLRGHFQRMIDHIAQIKQAVKEVQSAPKGILGLHTDGGASVWDPLLGGKHILVVDDELFIRQTIADVVQRHGCIADAVRDGKEALERMGEKSYDLVISDIKLPGASGYEVFAAARSGGRDIPVILMTGFGYDPNHSIVRAHREGLRAVLYKPFKVDQLLEEIRQALAKR